MARPLSIDPYLADASRLSGVPAEFPARGAAAALFGFGALAAAAVCFVEVKWKLPGHAILRASLPMAFGLALFPRRYAGAVMGAGAATVGLALHWSGFGERGLGSLTSLLILGPMMDLAISWNRGRRSVVVAAALAGLATNLAALGVQAAAKSLGLDSGGGKPVGVWILKAGWTYPTFGLLAGLASGAALFRMSRGTPRSVGRGDETGATGRLDEPAREESSEP